MSSRDLTTNRRGKSLIVKEFKREKNYDYRLDRKKNADPTRKKPTRNLVPAPNQTL